jgi:transposase InsO family protein
MAKHRRPPSQGWRTFLRNHADGIASMDLFVVPAISFRLLYGLLILGHARREILWLGVTAHPSAEWMARQLTEACGWKRTPEYLVRDRDAVYGEIFIRRLRAMGIRDRPIAPRSPWQNGQAERLIGSLRRECLDHVAVFGEQHLRQLLLLYMDYYNRARTIYPWTRMRQYRGLFNPLAVSTRSQFSAVYIINMFGFDLRKGQAAVGRAWKLFQEAEHRQEAEARAHRA